MRLTRLEDNTYNDTTQISPFLKGARVLYCTSLLNTFATCPLTHVQIVLYCQIERSGGKVANDLSVKSTHGFGNKSTFTITSK